MEEMNLYVIIVTHLGHFSKDYKNPTMTCSYCKYFDHSVEECPQLIVKWKARNLGNQNPPQNPKLNIQNISIEPREPNIVIVIRGGVATRSNQEAPYEQPRVRSTQQKKILFDVKKEK